MIDKLLLNNQIISNKKKIQKARVQTINKLVQKIRKLKELSTKYPDKTNISSNLTKTPLILGYVKKLKVAEIIRKVLTLNKKPAAVLTNGQAKPEDVAVAFLATNKIIDVLASGLKVTLHLNDNNPGWQDEIMELSKKKKFLLKNAERKKQKKSQISSKSSLRKTKPSWREENVEIDSNTILKTTEDVPQTQNGWKVEPLENILENTAEPFIKPSKSISKSRKDTRTPEETTETTVNDNRTEESSLLEQKNVTTIDSFFFTATGDNYVSSVILKEKQPEGPNDGLDRRERRQHQRGSYQSSNRQMRPSYNKRPHQNDGSHGRPSFNRRHSDERQSYSSSKVKPQENHQNLHPSWAAKQKMNPSGVEFKGRKIKFDDDSNEKNLANSFVKNSNKSRAPPQTTDANSENLHPSWAAKQKLKPTITEFKGTKITFDD